MFKLIVLVSLWVATECTAWALQWYRVLGKSMLGRFIYNPINILIWIRKFNNLSYGMAVMKVFERAHLIMGAGWVFHSNVTDHFTIVTARFSQQAKSVTFE